MLVGKWNNIQRRIQDFPKIFWQEIGGIRQIFCHLILKGAHSWGKLCHMGFKGGVAKEWLCLLPYNIPSFFNLMFGTFLQSISMNVLATEHVSQTGKK